MSGESQIILIMLGGIITIMMFFFRHLSTRITNLKNDKKELAKVVCDHSNVLSAICEINRKMEQWYFKNIPELHDEVKAIKQEMGKARTSIERLKAMNILDAQNLLKDEKSEGSCG